MKLWIAEFFTTDECARFDVKGYLVRARDPGECASVAEAHLQRYPGELSGDFEPWVGLAFELPQHAPAEDPAVVSGPFSTLSGTPMDGISWRRDEGDAFWVNIGELVTMKPLDQVLWDDPRGWPHTNSSQSAQYRNGDN